MMNITKEERLISFIKNINFKIKALNKCKVNEDDENCEETYFCISLKYDKNLEKILEEKKDELMISDICINDNEIDDEIEVYFYN